MQDVVCQLVGIGMVPQYVMNGKGAVGTVRHVVLPGEMLHVNTIIHHVQGLLPSDIHSLYPCTWIFRLFICRLSFGLKMRPCSVPVVCLRGVKYGNLPLFRGVELEMQKPQGIVNLFAAIAAWYVYECIQGNIACLWHHVPHRSAGEILNKLHLLCQLNSLCQKK